MNCPQCNYEVNEDVETCPQCGEILTQYEEGNNSEYHAPGKNFIKIVSIIGISMFVIAGCVLGCSLAVMDTMADEFVAMGLENPMEELSELLTPAMMTYFVIIILFQLFVYITGLMYCANLEKAGFLKTIATVYLVITAAHVLLGLFQISGVLDFIMLLVTLPFIAAIPVVYYIGARKNVDEYNGIAS